MATDILRTQLKTASGYNSLVVGYLNPVWYTFRQYTHTFTGITEPVPGILVVTMPSTAFLVAGHLVRISGGSYDGTQVGTISAVNGNVHMDVTGITFRGNASGYFIDVTLIRNLGMETRMVDPTSGNVISRATSFWTAGPNLTGIMDLQSELKSLFYGNRETPVIASGPSLYRHITFGTYKLQWRESFIDINNVPQKGTYADIAENVIVTPSRKQLKELYGNNLLDFLVKDPTGGAPIGKFLTSFLNPRMWGTQARSISFVLGTSNYGTTTRVQQVAYTAAGGSLGVVFNDYSNLTPGIYSWVMTYVPNAAYYLVDVRTPAALKLVKEIRVNAVDICNPYIGVEWENSLGGFDQWVFQRAIEVAMEPGASPVISERYDPDIENSKGNLYRDSVDLQETITVFDDNVPTGDLVFLDSLKKSKQVRLFLTGGGYIVVVPTGSTTVGAVRNKVNRITVQLQMPRNFNPQVL
jgi:hypothetical protein